MKHVVLLTLAIFSAATYAETSPCPKLGGIYLSRAGTKMSIATDAAGKLVLTMRNADVTVDGTPYPIGLGHMMVATCAEGRIQMQEHMGPTATATLLLIPTKSGFIILSGNNQSAVFDFVTDQLEALPPHDPAQCPSLSGVYRYAERVARITRVSEGLHIEWEDGQVAQIDGKRVFDPNTGASITSSCQLGKVNIAVVDFNGTEHAVTLESTAKGFRLSEGVGDENQSAEFIKDP